MPRPPAGPIGNSPRDVRDDAVGVPADNVQAPEPPRWPPKRKKITSNTFHAKVSGSTLPKRSDRRPHFRRGGMVKGFASGGSVEAKMEKRDELPGEQKNDPFAKQNIKKAKGGPVAKAGRFQGGGRIDTAGPRPVPRAPLRSEFTEAEKARRTLQRTPFVSLAEDVVGAFSPGKAQENALREAVRRKAADDIKASGYEQENKGFGRGYDFKKSGGGVKKRQAGGKIEKPPSLPIEDRAAKVIRPLARDIPPASMPRTGSHSMGSGSYRKMPSFEEKSGGTVKKRQAGGEIDVPNKPPVMPDKPFEHTGQFTEGGKPMPAAENTAEGVARGWNTFNRALGRPLSPGAFHVQKHADMRKAERISDLVPRRQEALTGPGGIGSRKKGGKVK